MHNALRIYLRRIGAISEFAGMTARWAAVVMMLVLLFEVVSRYGFNAPTIWVHELSQHLWGFYILFGAAYVMRHRAHVNLDVIYRKFSLRKQAILDSITYWFFFIYCAVILWQAVPHAWQSAMRIQAISSIWASPVWPLKVMIPIAVLLLLLQGLGRYISSLHIAITGRELE